MRHSSPNKVLLTGSTGFLGARVLQDLLTIQPAVAVTCIVRGDDVAHARVYLQKKLAENEVWPLLGWERVEILAGDIMAPRFGLSNETYAQLSSTVTSIVHTAAQIKLTLPAEELHQLSVQSLDTIIDLAGASGRKKCIVFVSSISAVGLSQSKWVAEDLEGAGGESVAFGGYGLTKWRAEQYLKKRVAMLGLTAVVVRAPFIVGDRIAQHMSVPTMIVQIACVTKLLPEWTDERSCDMYPIAPLSRGCALAAVDFPITAGQVTVLHFVENNPMTFVMMQKQLMLNGLETRYVPYAEWDAALVTASKTDAFAKQLRRALPLFRIAYKTMGHLEGAVLATTKTEQWMKGHGLESLDKVQVCTDFLQAVIKTVPKRFVPVSQLPLAAAIEPMVGVSF
jgi:thioester reductase-like protein